MTDIMKLTPLEKDMIALKRAESALALRLRMRRLRTILKSLNKRERRIWMARYRCGMFLFLDPQL